jgi:hypothetical protein
MSLRPAGYSAIWVIVAIPAAVVVFLLTVALVIIALRPDQTPSESVVITAPATPPAPRNATPAAPQPPTPVPPPAAARAAPPTRPAPLVPTPPAPRSTAPVIASPPRAATAPVALAGSRPSASPSVIAGTPPPVVAAASSPVDLLASLDLDANTISGDWRREGAAIRCGNATVKNRAKLRLVPPPPGDGYDFAVTFTTQGERRFVAQVLSFRGRQFIFAMFSSQSGFASVRGQNALANETTRNKGVSAGTRHTSLVKVRDREVSAYIDGELVSTYATDYSDLDVSEAWNLGPSSTREQLLGLAVECPVVIESITLTPLDAQPASAPAPSSYKDLAAMISSPFSTESSAAATQPATGRRRGSRGELQSLVAASQPVVSDVAAELLQKLVDPLPGASRPAGGGDAGVRDAFFHAVRLSTSPAAQLADPLLESQPQDDWPAAVERAEFDAGQARLAAWRTLIARINDFYPNARPQRDLVKLQLGPAGGAARGKPASFFATHAHSKPLTHVTLAIEIVHAMTSPAPTAVHHYFIPRWKPGQKIFFPATVVPNVSSPELLDHPGLSPPNSLSGVIEARVQVWSDQLAQPAETTSFDANFQAMARAQLDEAYRLVDEALRGRAPASGPATGTARPVAPPPRAVAALIAGPIIPARTDLHDDSPELVRARAAARRARRLLPPQSSLADEARDLITQPQAALRDLRKRQIDAFVAALALRSPRPGVWVKHRPGMLARLAKPADREAALSEAGGAGGRLTLTIDSRMSDGSNVGVTLTSDEQPDVRRKFTGRLQVDAGANRLLLNLRATQPPASRPPAEADLKRVVHWTSLLLELRNNTLCGIATAGPPDAVSVLNVAFAPPAASPKSPPTAQPRPSPPRPK